MKKRLKIFCTSSLASSNTAWKKLNKNYNVSFTEFVDLNNEKTITKLHEINYFIIYIDDLIENYSNKDLEKINFKKTFFNKLEKVSKSNNSIIIVSILLRESSNPINFTKFKNPQINFFNELDENLYKLSTKNENVFNLNVNSTFNKAGNDKVYDSRNWYSFRLRVNQKGLNLAVEDLDNLLNRLFFPAKKVIILDCDNTLWGGVIGEDGVANLKIGTDGEGKAYKDFQKKIKSLLNNGFLLCLSSKNNEKEVWDVFKKHPEMILKKQDITLSYINWSEKVDNIKKISQKLSLSLDSFIFIDDNPLERDLVKKLLPQVEVLDMPTDVSFWPNYLEQLNLLSNIKITKEDSDKKNQYIKKFKFEKDLKKNKNKKEFLKKININIKIEKVSKFHLSRASQMTVKTNQFNFTSKRYSVNELAKHNDKKNNMVFILKLKDNYGHHGYVSLIFISKVNKNFIIDNFLMSCRVLGRNIEKLFLRKIFKKIKNKNNHVFIEFKDSKRNKLAKNFIEENKFRSLNIKEKKNFKFKQKQNVYIVKL